MQLIESVQEMIAWRKEYSEFSLGFVPTMGYLHGGHLSLVERAMTENQITCVSIFVNPAQFGPAEDFKSYPRDLARDLGLLRCCSVGVIFSPHAKEMYPPDFQTYVSVQDVTRPLEGAARPGHFAGVTTIVAKLFNIVQPTRVYFGQKDAQQVKVIEQMVRDLNYPLEIVTCPIVREPDGLAMSSRNTYLSDYEREQATVIYRSLATAKRLYEGGQRDPRTIKAAVLDVLKQEPAAEIEYVSLADNHTLQEVTRPIANGQEVLISMAVKLGQPRLIDNLILGGTDDDGMLAEVNEGIQ